MKLLFFYFHSFLGDKGRLGNKGSDGDKGPIGNKGDKGFRGRLGEKGLFFI